MVVGSGLQDSCGATEEGLGKISKYEWKSRKWNT